MSALSAGRIRFVRALSSQPFARLWIGQTVSMLGNGVYTTALAWVFVAGRALNLGLSLIALTLRGVRELD